MAVLRTTEIRKMNPEQRASQLRKLREQLMKLRAEQNTGGSLESYGQIKAIRRTIARILTIQKELGEA